LLFHMIYAGSDSLTPEHQGVQLLALRGRRSPLLRFSMSEVPRVPERPLPFPSCVRNRLELRVI